MTRLITFDTESDGFLEDATVLWCAASHVHGEDAIRSWVFPKDKEEFLVHLRTADVLIGHNLIGHDLPLLRKLWGSEPQPEQKIVDTMWMSRLQNPDRRKPPHCPARVGPHSVQAWGYRLGDPKVEHDEWDRFSPEMLVRCIKDVGIQVKIYKELLKEGKGKGWSSAHRTNMQLFTWLQRQEEAGFPVDKSLMESSVAQLTRWIDRIDRVVTPRLPIIVEVDEGKVKGEYGYVRKPFKKDGSYASVTERFLTEYSQKDTAYKVVTEDHLVGGPFSRVSFRYTNLNSNMEIKDFLLKSGWIPDEWNTNNDGVRTSPKMSKTDPFIGIEGALGRIIVKRVQCRQRKGVIEGWLEQIRPDEKLPGIVTGIAVTGRARHKLIVNVPNSDAFYGSSMRAMFVASPKKVLVGVDSTGNQIRQLAAHMGDATFTSVVLAPDQDIHTFNQGRAGIATRHAAKTFFYALIFGAGDAKIARQLRISLGQAKRLRQDFMSGLPAMQELLERLYTEWKANGGWIKGLDGRPITVPGTHQLLVYLLQSDEAIHMAKAYVRFHTEAAKRWNYGEDWETVLWYHDEFQVMSTPDIADAIGKIGCDSITWAGEALGISILHEGKYKIGKNWLETH